MTLPQRDRLARSADPRPTAVYRLRTAAAGFVDAWRRPRPEAETRLRHVEAAIVLGLCAVVALIGWFGDLTATRWARGLDPQIATVFGYITRLGTSGYVFLLAAVILVGGVLLQGRDGARRFDAAMGRLAGRAAFIIAVNAIAGLASLLLKHLFGRARPKLIDMVGPFHFDTFAIDSTYASFPSGHTVTAFGTAIALGYFMPALRWPLLALAVLVGVSRVIVGAHYPSDVAAGAAIGVGTAILLRRAFARRHLVFRHTPSAIHPRGAGRISSNLRRRSSRP